MDFTITSKTKSKAKKRRIKNEGKWAALRIISIVSLAVSAVSGIAGIFFVPYERYTLAGILGVLFSVCLILFFCLQGPDLEHGIPLDRRQA